MGIMGEVRRINQLLEETRKTLEEVIRIYTGDAPQPKEPEPENMSLEREITKADETASRILDYSDIILRLFRGDETACSCEIPRNARPY